MGQTPEQIGELIAQQQRDLAFKWANNKKTKDCLLELYLMNLHIIGTLTALMEHLGLTEGIPSGKVPGEDKSAAVTGQAGPQASG